MKNIAFVDSYNLYKKLKPIFEDDISLKYFNTIDGLKSVNNIELVILNILDYSEIEGFKSKKREYLGLTHIPIIYVIDIFRNGFFKLKNSLDDYLFKPFEMELLINRVMIRLEIKSIYDKLRHMISQQMAMLDLSEQLSFKKNQDYSQFDSVVEKLSQMFEVDNLSIIIYNEDGVLNEVSSLDGFGNLEKEIDINNYPEMKKAINTKKPYYIEDIKLLDNYEIYRPCRYESSIISLITIPIIYNEEVFGVISIKFPRSSSEVYRNLINYSLIIANTTAIALKNSRILKELKKQTEISTSYKVRREEFIKSIRHYSYLVERSNIPMILMDKTGEIHLVNIHSEEILGFNRFDLLKMNFYNLITEESCKKFKTLLKKVMKDSFIENISINLVKEKEEKLLSIVMLQKNIFILYLE